MRPLFVTGPAVLLSAPACLLHPLAAVVVFIGMVGLGWSVTEPRPERGEYR